MCEDVLTNKYFEMDDFSKSNAEVISNPDLPELKRIQSIKQKIKLYQNKQDAIRTALGNLDTRPNTVIKFDENCSQPVEFNTAKLNVTENRPKKLLFDSDGEEEDSFEFKDSFNSDGRQQLLNLQSKYKGDQRFKLDERFIDQDNEEDSEQVGKTIHADILEEEKKNEIEILEQILGPQMKPKKKTSLHEVKMLRFDPNDSNHVKYQLSSKHVGDSNKKQCVEEKNDKEDQNIPNLSASKTQFYKVSGELKNSFNAQEEFSVLNLFGKKSHINNDIENEDYPVHIQKKISLEKNPFQYDSSDSEDAEPKCKNDSVTQESEFKFPSESFFFKEDDFRIQEGADFIKRVASVKNSEFFEQRKNLKNIIRTKVRNNNLKKNPFRTKLSANRKRKMFRIKNCLNR